MVGRESLKTSLPSFGASPRNITAVRLAHSPKAPKRMLVTLSGIVILVRLVHLRKALNSMLLILLGIVILVKLVQP